MNRGSGEQPSGADVPVPGFNEAPIHESGKFCHLRSPCVLPFRFNEAPIHESGKWPWLRCAGSLGPLLQ